MNSNDNSFSSRGKLKDLILSVVIGLVFISTGLYLFTDIDKIILSYLHKGTGIASLTNKENIVKVKEETSLGWKDAYKNNSLSNNQQVFTGSQSKAQITFKSGPIINLNENSLVKLSTEENKTSIDLYSGLMYVALKKTPSEKESEIKIGNKIIKTTQNEVVAQISAEKGKDTNQFMVVKEGELTVESEGKTVTAKQDEYITTTKEGELKAIPLEFILKTPDDGARFYALDKINVLFEWNINKDKADSQFILSRTSNFLSQDIIRKEQLSTTRLSLTLQTGTYFWKVTSPGGQQISSIRTLEILGSTPPKLITPKNDIVFEILDEKDQTRYVPVRLNWEQVPYATSFEIEFKDFQGQTSLLSTSELEYNFPKLGSGRYEWRVRAVFDQEHKSEWSSASIFYYTMIARINLISPGNASRMAIQNYSKDKMIFQWDYTNGGAKKFLFVLASDENLQNVILKREIKEKTHEIPLSTLPLSTNTFYWQVIPIDFNDNEKHLFASMVRSFSVDLSAPHLIEPDHQSVIPLRTMQSTVHLKWQDFSQIFPKQNISYEIQIAHDENFQQDIFSEITNHNEMDWKHKELGGHYWRVRALVEQQKNKNALVTPFSQTQSFKIYCSAPPRLIAPADKTVFDILDEKDQTKNIPVRLTWEQIPSATSFEIEFKDSQSRTSVFSTPALEYNFPKLASGRYEWRVRAVFDQEHKSEWSKPFNFYYTLIARINLINPANAHHFTIQNYGKDKMIFQWDYTNVGAKKFFFVLASDENLKNVVLKKEIDEKTYEIALSTLSPSINTFYWQIIPVDSNSNEKTLFASAVRSFSIDLPVPSLTEPKTQNAIPLYTRQSTIPLKWQNFSSVFPGHKISYEIQISHEENFKKIRFSEITTNHEINWHPREFGRYYWRIRVLTEAKTNIKLITPFSEVKSFDVTLPHPLPPPPLAPIIKLKYQKENSQHTDGRNPSSMEDVIVGNYVNIDIPVLEAYRPFIRGYLIQIYEDSSLTRLVLSEKLEINRFKWKAPRQGNYYIRVAYIDDWNQTGEFSTPAQMVIEKIQLTLPDIILERPAAFEKISYYEDESRPTVFSWDSIQNAASYELQISTTLDFDKDVVYKQTSTTNNTTIDSLKLEQGSYYWRVVANPTNDDYLANASKRRRITFMKIQKEIPKEIPKPELQKQKEEKEYLPSPPESANIAILSPSPSPEIKELRKTTPVQKFSFSAQERRFFIGGYIQDTSLDYSTFGSEVHFATSKVIGALAGVENLKAIVKDRDVDLSAQIRILNIKNPNFTFDSEYTFFTQADLIYLRREHFIPYVQLRYEHANFMSTNTDSDLVPQTYNAILAGLGGKIPFILYHSRSCFLAATYFIPASFSTTDPYTNAEAGGHIWETFLNLEINHKFFIETHYEKIDLDSKLNGSRIHGDVIYKF